MAQTKITAIAALALGGSLIAQNPSMMAGIGWRTDAIFTIGEFSVDSNGAPYQPVGIPDGMAAFANPNGPGALVYVNNELRRGSGRPFTIDNGTMLTGARITKYCVQRRADGSGFVTLAEQAIKRIYDRDGQEVVDPAQINVGTGGINGLGRFCSSFGIAGGTYGFVEDVYFTGEEDSTNAGGSFWALDIDTGDFWAVPALPRASWENLTPFETGDPQTVGLALADDSTGTPFYIYIGTKNAVGDQSFLDRNGLAQGVVYTFRFDDQSLQDASDFNGVGSTAPGNFVRIDVQDPSMAGQPGFDAAGYKDDTTFRAEAEATGAFEFARLEDIDVNPANGLQVVVCSTGNGGFAGGADAYGDVHIIDLDLSNPSAPTASFRIAADGDDTTQTLSRDEGLRSPDNLTWASDGLIYIQEDRSVAGFGATSGREASIWALDPTTTALTRVGEMNRSVVLPLDATDGDPTDVGDWESSGIIDVTALFDTQPGELLMLANVQAHSIRDGSIGGDPGLVQGGQLFFMSNFGIDHAIRAQNVNPAQFNLKVDFSNFQPGDMYAVFLSFTNAGAAPDGWFFGISPTLLDLGALLFPPWVGFVGNEPNFGFEIPIFGQAPIGIAFDSVAVRFDGQTMLPLQSGPAVTNNL